MASSRNTIGKKEINILLLGETGVGKSTFINGLVNHLSYDKIDDALGKDLLSLIPTSFVVQNSENEDQRISHGNDENEVLVTGQSSTQMPRQYEFRFSSDGVLRIIDTPGIGNTRGIDQDKINLQYILTFISHYDHLDGICLLMRPDITRASPSFLYRIKELLTHLHKSVAENIVICFTNARKTFFKPGDTRQILEDLFNDLKTNRGIEVPFDKENTFFFDNESYRFVLAQQQGVQFDEDQEEAYRKSWNKSVAQTKKFMAYLAQRPSHRIKETLSLNKARRLIDELNRPIAEIVRNIQYNRNLITKKIDELNTIEGSISDLQKRLKFMAVDLKVIALIYPRTVCAADSCIGHIKFNNQVKIEYKTHCHERCYLENVPVEVVGHPALKKCNAMNEEAVCKKCGCSWEKHQYISYETQQEMKEDIDTSVERQIAGGQKSIQITRQYIEGLQRKNQEFEQEQSDITRTCVQLSRFLEANCIIPYNDNLFEYVNYLIREEQLKNRLGADNQSVINGLNDLVETYRATMDTHKTRLNVSDTHGQQRILRLEDIETEIESLYRLPYSGQLLRTQIEIIRHSSTATYRNGSEHSQPRNPIFLKNLRLT